MTVDLRMGHSSNGKTIAFKERCSVGQECGRCPVRFRAAHSRFVDVLAVTVRADN